MAFFGRTTVSTIDKPKKEDGRITFSGKVFLPIKQVFMRISLMTLILQLSFWVLISLGEVG